MALNLHERSGYITSKLVEWHLVDALLGGTLTMRAAGKLYLPQWPAEPEASYEMRRQTATLFPAFSRTLSVMAGKPFAKELTLSDDADPLIQQLAQDIDREGSSLHTFAARVMREALAYGLCGVLVENVRRPEGIGNYRDQEMAAGLRPYMVLYRHDQILGWREEKVNGRNRLTQLRLRESVDVADGDFGAKTVERVRVLEPGSWYLYEQQSGSGYVLIDQGATEGMSDIPFVPFYGKRTDFMKGVSPLLELAWLNVKHWQSQSDQDNILHVARVPILCVTGATDDVELHLGASAAVLLPENSSLHFVEHSGSAISAGAQSLAALEQQMIQTGAELLVKQPGTRTATESSNDAEASRSELLAIVENFEDSLDQCLQFLAEWSRLTSHGTVTLYKDFGAASLSEASAQLVLSMQGAGVITKATVIREQQRRGLLSPDIDPDSEVELAEQSMPAVTGGTNE